MATSAAEPVYRDPNLKIVFAVTLTAVMGVSSITPAFPRIAEAFGVAPQKTGLLITFYYVPGVVMTPVLGFLSDRWGRRPVLIPSLFVFGLAGAACGLVRHFEWLLAFRFVQGLGAASLAAINLTIIGDLFEGERRTEAMGYNASVLSVGTAAYPAIGGAMATLGWFVPFFLPLFGLVTGVVVLACLDNPEPDGVGAFGEYLGVFAEVLKDLEVVGIFGLSFVLFVILFGPYLTYFPILMDETFGSSSWVIGVVISSVSVASGLTAASLGYLSRHFAKRSLIAVGFALYALAFASMPYVESIASMLLPSLLYGVGQGLNVPSLQSLMAGMAPMEQRGAFMSVSGMVNRIGQTLGPMSAGLLYARWGLEGVFVGTAVASVAMVVPALGLLGR